MIWGRDLDLPSASSSHDGPLGPSGVGKPLHWFLFLFLPLALDWASTCSPGETFLSRLLDTRCLEAGVDWSLTCPHGFSRSLEAWEGPWEIDFQLLIGVFAFCMNTWGKGDHLRRKVAYTGQFKGARMWVLVLHENSPAGP